MNEREFQINMRGGETLRRVSQDPLEDDFWSGYLHGLRRHYHGEQFGTDAEHALWMKAATSDDASRRSRGHGYDLGFKGWGVAEALEWLETKKVGP